MFGSTFLQNFLFRIDASHATIIKINDDSRIYFVKSFELLLEETR
jgi:imidazoleglycerol phosphate synthase glutamine amidotransferase subunit HisH